MDAPGITRGDTETEQGFREEVTGVTGGEGVPAAPPGKEKFKISAAVVKLQ